MENTIHYVLILDQSGSMSHLKEDVINCYNQQVKFIKNLKKENPEIDLKITFCKFNDIIDFIYKIQGVESLKKLTMKDYNPDNCTALFDAIGECYSLIDSSIQPSDKVFFSIFTDGLENASRRFNVDSVNEILLSAEKRGWKIKFFCSYDDLNFYQIKMKLNKNSFVPIQMHEEGICQMVCEANHILRSMIDLDKNL